MMVRGGRSLSQLLLPQTLALNAFLALGFISAATSWRVSWETVALILLAFLGARNAGHAFNHIVDRRYDAGNPRTLDRPLVTGAMGLGVAWTIVGLNTTLLLLCAWLLNPLVFLLAPVALALLFGYSFAKRFTAWTTVLLGLVQAMVPAGVYLATQRALPSPALAAGAAVLLFGTAFETVHSLGDMESDRQLSLHSLPLVLGARRSIALVGGLFAASCVLFGLFAHLVPLGPSFYILLGGMGMVAAWEVVALWRRTRVEGPGFPSALEGAGVPLMANMLFGALFFAGVLFGLYAPL